MKSKLILVLIGLVVWAGFVCASPKVEWAALDERPIVIGVYGAKDIPISNDDPTLFRTEYLFGDKDYEIEWRWYPSGVSGSDSKVHTEVIAGNGPDVFFDYMGRVSQYAVPKYAVELTPYLSEEIIDSFIPSYLSLMQKDGGQYGLPGDAWISTMIINVDLLNRVDMSYIIEQGEWSIDEFIEASRRVTALGLEYYGFHLFSATTGGDYWYLGFLPGFGANLYENGAISIDNEAGRQALAFYRDFQAEGLSPPGAAGTGYREFVASFQTGTILAYANNPNKVGPTLTELGTKSFVAGTSDYPFTSIPFPFPKADGIDKAPVALGPNGAMLFRKPYGVTEEAIDALITLTGLRAQTGAVQAGTRWSSLIALQESDTENLAWILGSRIMASQGVWDMGIGLPTYGAVRPLVPPLFQAIYTGELTVQEAIDRFVRDGNAAIESVIF